MRKNIFLIFIFYPSMLKILTKLHYHSRFRQSKKFKISQKNMKLFEEFYSARKHKNPLYRLYIIFFKNKIRRQTLQGNCLFIIAILLNKV